jgi:glycerophosphoryl diester phosphodiesterase
MPCLPGRPGAPIGFAHRGARAERRENTIDAFARALELGANGLESDAWVTADGTVVLDHDGVVGPIWRRRAISVQARSGLPGHIPSLQEMYDRCGVDFELSLDLKDLAALEPVIAVAAAAGAVEHLWLCYHDWTGMAGEREALTAGAHLVESTSVSRIPEGLPARARVLSDAGITAVNLHRSEWDPERVAAVHGPGLSAFGWDAQSSRQLRHLLGLGLDGVYSDHVDRMVAALAAPPNAAG